MLNANFKKFNHLQLGDRYYNYPHLTDGKTSQRSHSVIETGFKGPGLSGSMTLAVL